MHLIGILVTVLLGLSAKAITLDELGQYDCLGLEEVAGHPVKLQTRIPEGKATHAVVLKKQFGENSFEVVSYPAHEKGTLTIENNAAGTLKIMVTPNGYGIGPSYQCQKSTEGTKTNPKIKPAVK